MIAIILYVFVETLLIGVFSYSSLMVESALTFSTAHIVFIGLNNLTFIILYFKNPGHLTIKEQCSQSKIQITSPKFFSGEKQYLSPIKGNNNQKKVLNSSLIIYKNRMSQSHEKIERENYSEEHVFASREISIKDNDIQILNVGKIIQSTVYIEQPQCTICYILQPLRAKHCKKCDRCIATYDHHNPITNRCVGEKNKLLYIVQSCLQIGQLLFLLMSSLDCFKADHLKLNLYQHIISFLQLFLAIIITCLSNLLVYHFYLIITNQTLYEHQYKDRITQFKSVAEDNLRPFSLGLFQNCLIFLHNTFTSNSQHWTLDN